MKLREHLQTAQQALQRNPAARLEAEILLAHVLQRPRAYLYANPDLELQSDRSETFSKLVERRAKGEPVAYLTGVREFWSLPLKVTRDVLIPRPETELLVEAALARIPDREAARVADIGTGSGAVALALASERKQADIHATDISAAAISLARENARTLGLDVQFHTGSWCEPLQGRFDLIVSNPPYVADNDPHLQRGDCRFEPRDALTPGGDGLGAIREITAQASKMIRPGGWLLFEHGFEQGEAVCEILMDEGFSGVESLRDLEGHERVSLGRLKYLVKGGRTAGGPIPVTTTPPPPARRPSPPRPTNIPRCGA